MFGIHEGRYEILLWEQWFGAAGSFLKLMDIGRDACWNAKANSWWRGLPTRLPLCGGGVGTVDGKVGAGEGDGKYGN